jgi:hypothetical protein
VTKKKPVWKEGGLWSWKRKGGWGRIVQDVSGVFVGGKIFVGGGVFCLVLGEIFLRRLVGLVWQENMFFVSW